MTRAGLGGGRWQGWEENEKDEEVVGKRRIGTSPPFPLREKLAADVSPEGQQCCRLINPEWRRVRSCSSSFLLLLLPPPPPPHPGMGSGKWVAYSLVASRAGSLRCATTTVARLVQKPSGYCSDVFKRFLDPVTHPPRFQPPEVLSSERGVTCVSASESPTCSGRNCLRNHAVS